MFSLNQTTIMNAARGGGILSIINSVLSPGYGIYYASGSNKGGKPFSPTSFISVETGKEATIATAPLEKGGYSSYNKVQRPGEVRVTFTIEGWTGFSGAIPNLTNLSLTSRADVLETLDKMIASAETYDIETPDTTYTSYDLTKYDYRIRSESGVTLLIVNAVFQAVMDVAEVKVSGGKSKGEQQNNKICKSPSMDTESNNSGTKPPTLSDVKSALTGLKKSLSSAATKVADKVTSEFTKATSSVAGSLNNAVISSVDQMSKGVTDLAKNLT
ncbi:hypothetical protein PSI23_17555 [Xenorhabdus sp. XENO-10]|uniref:Dit-like phage tail protein N-terminal domain-containing protein n=1 Tax=Xenorhabdus yunnanensis TaxID=3025878 RepID=A0ABT5LIT2_9GAMM|nr:hypothetical protein [Xenorhabdus yunnanensis]MDC9591042.1 hypothetical protein [Xenorhabdus yunnanensis]